MMHRLKYAFLVAVTATFASGCQSLKPNWVDRLPWMPDSKVVESEFKEATRMASFWTPDVLTQAGSAPVRGFGGRLFFYGQRGKAIPVEGQLVVYAYDDTATGTQGSKTPNRKFVFTPEQFTEHIGNSELGVAYSIWLPWDPVGGDQASITLVPVFTSTQGKVVMGKQALTVLPGRVKPQEAVTEPQVQTVTYNQTSPSQRTHTRKRKQVTVETTTIDLTPSLRQKMIAAGDSKMLARPRWEVPEAAKTSTIAAAFSREANPAAANITATATAPATNRGQQATPASRFARPRYPAPRAPRWRSAPVGADWKRPQQGPPSVQEPSLQPAAQPIPNQGFGANGTGILY
jgi:hypothetical protein